MLSNFPLLKGTPSTRPNGETGAARPESSGGTAGGTNPGPGWCQVRQGGASTYFTVGRGCCPASPRGA